MSSFLKSKLKEAREALGKKDYNKAREAATQILDYEPENYNAYKFCRNVFLGLALLELGQYDKSEQAYQKAIDLQPTQLLAWQGISKFYERTERWDKYADTLNHLIKLFSRINDATKTAETLQKYIEFRRERGSRAEIVDALFLLLPESPFYSVLSTLPSPDPANPTSTTTLTTQEAMENSLPILEEIIALTEKDEEETIKKEVDKRRMRLGASSPGELKKEVNTEVLGSSKLPHLYDEVLNHPNTPDDLRRITESKLLRHKLQYLHALPVSGKWASVKAKIATEVEQLVHGTVLLGLPDELAWTIFIEGKNSDTIEGYDSKSLQQFIILFPLLPLAKLIKGYFTYIGAALSNIDDGDNEPPPAQVDEEAFVLILEAFDSLPDSILAHRIVADLYLRESDYQNSIRIAESGLELVRRSEIDNTRELAQVRKAFNVVLVTSLVHFFPPKHHPRALGIIDEVLAQEPDNIPSLMGRAYVLQFICKWDEAGVLFAKVAQLIPEDLDDGLRAKEEVAWCGVQAQDVESGISGLKSVLDILEGLDNRDHDRARCLWRLGKCYWDMGDEQREEAYRCFITALKRSSTYAPAFTSLGIYYSEFVSPPDPIRASKCFQKAFELDSREAYAARKLAEGFAEDREWDLVEVVARRTIDGEGGLDAGLKDGSTAAGRYLPTNAWAWKAVGVVELTRKNYPPAIQAFQIALRAEPDDQLSWLRLGEAYSRAGRHAAAVKALARAQELSPNDWICSYFIGEVHHQTGRFQEAIDAFESILIERPSEIGVLMPLAQTHLDFGRHEISVGFLARAEQSFGMCVQVAVQAIRETSGFRNMAWKTAADAIFHLSKQSSFFDVKFVRTILSDAISLLPAETSTRLSNLLSLPKISSNLPLSGHQALEIAIVAYDCRLSSVDAATGSSWYDLGIALHYWSTKSFSKVDQERANKLAVECLTTALREDPGNDAYWNALGSVNFVAKPKSAQHAYIRALEIDHKNVVTWTNLGLLYLYHNDLQLANEALYRAQTLDPDHTVAWAGQGLVATANGHDSDAKAMFEHAVGLTADVPEADLEYASRVFSSLSHTTYGSSPSYDAIFPAFFVLDRYRKQRPDDATGLHLFGLVCERIGQIELGIDFIQQAISILEAIYEETEDPVVEQQFTFANSNLARLRLSAHDYEGALESFESALGLLSEDSSAASDLILRTQAHFGSGLAQFKLGNLQEALSLFETALESAADNPLISGQVTVLLAQTMWAIGTEEFKESAKALLLDCITNDPENLAAINALAGMGILTDDDSLVDAALSEILSLPLERRHILDPRRDVNYLLIQHHLAQGDMTQALSVAQHAVHTEPSLSPPKHTLASLNLQQGQYASALAVLASQTGDNLVEVREGLGLSAIAESMNRSGDEGLREAMRRAQKAIILAPWDVKNWQTLAYVKSQ